MIKGDPIISRKLSLYEGGLLGEHRKTQGIFQRILFSSSKLKLFKHFWKALAPKIIYPNSAKHLKLSTGNKQCTNRCLHRTNQGTKTCLHEKDLSTKNFLPRKNIILFGLNNFWCLGYFRVDNFWGVDLFHINYW